MCGRYNLSTPAEVLAAVFRIAHMPGWTPRYNVAPTQMVPVIRSATGPGQAGGLRCDLLHWGLIPSWADDPKIGNRLINARSESAPEKPAFRKAFRCRRCLVPANGFYEWRKPLKGKVGRKQPFYIRRGDDKPLAFAGLWENWHGEDGREIESFTILTTQSNALVKPIHDRMPVILSEEDYFQWLNPTQENVEALRKMLKPFPGDELVAIPVSSRINSPSNDDAACVEEVVDRTASSDEQAARSEPSATKSRLGRKSPFKRSPSQQQSSSKKPENWQDSLFDA